MTAARSNSLLNGDDGVDGGHFKHLSSSAGRKEGFNKKGKFLICTSNSSLHLWVLMTFSRRRFPTQHHGEEKSPIISTRITFRLILEDVVGVGVADCGVGSW